MYDAVKRGELKEPKLELQYAQYEPEVRDALIELSDYAAKYSFAPTNYTPTKYTDPMDKTREYTLDDKAKQYYRELYEVEYQSVMLEETRKPAYKNANPETRAQMLEAARDNVAPQVKEQFMLWLAKNYKSAPKQK